MGFSRAISVFCCLLLIVVHAEAVNFIKDISLKGYYKCSLHPSNQLRLELFVYDENSFATRLNAIDASDYEITSCQVTGTGRLSSPFSITSKISMDDDSEVFNTCGMTKTIETNQKVYNWRVKAYTYPINYYPNNVGFILSLKCNTEDLSDGKVETIVDINNPVLIVSPQNPADQTGVDSIATNANIIYSAYLYPSGRVTPTELKNAKGFALYDCYSMTNPSSETNKEKFLDANGCPLTSAAYAPTSSFTQVSNTGDYIKLDAQFSKAVLVDNKRTIYITCSVKICTQTNDPCCSNYCSNNNACTSIVDTSVKYSTSFNVQDQSALQLFPSFPTGSTVLTSVNSGTNIRIIAQVIPGGIGANSNLRDANGIYVYSCRYSTNAQMTNSFTFVNADGCLVQNTKLTPVSDFVADDTLSITDSKFVSSTGTITVRNIGNVRLWVQCNTGKCTVAGHNYCTKRCGASNNNVGGAIDLGYIGHEFTLSVLDIANVPALSLSIVGPNGQALSSTSSPVTVGQNVNFGVEVTPGGTGTAGAAFANAKGVFIHSCYATQNNQRSLFIDANGCPVPGSPFRTGNCKDVTVVDGVSPFKVDCGTFTVPDTGDVQQTCNISLCTTERNIYCEDPCAAGEVKADSNVINPGVTTTSAFKTQPVNRPRTAVKSEELRNTIIAVSVVLAALILLATSVGTCLIVKKQKANAKRKLDGRRYNYY